MPPEEANPKEKNHSGILTLAFVTFLGIFSLFGYSQGVEHEAAEHAEIAAQLHHEDAARYILDNCAAIEGTALQNCITKAIKTSGEYQRAERDLAAQKSMANYAKWLLMVTAIGTIVATIGLYAVWKTLKETARSVNVANTANQIMREEQRPWVTLERDLFCDFADLHGIKGRLAWNYNLVNKGKTPAYSVRVHTKVVKSEFFSSALAEVDAFTEEAISRHKRGHLSILFPNEKTNFVRFRHFSANHYNASRDADGIWQQKKVKGEHYGFICCITYRLGLAPDSPIGVETRVLSLVDQKEVIGPWRHKMLEMTTERIVR